MAFPWAFAGTLAAGIFGAAGAASANRARAKEARLDREFQERMSSTAYQRQTKDLSAAGLNRILGYTKGGPASTPGGAMAQQQDIITPAISTALQTRRLNQEIKNMKQAEKDAHAHTDLNRALATRGWSDAYMSQLELQNRWKIFGGPKGDIYRAYKDLGTFGTSAYMLDKYGRSKNTKKPMDFRLFRNFKRPGD